MSNLIVRWSRRAAWLAASLLLCGCVISASGIYFDAEDFVVPKVFKGDWILVPSEGTDKEEEELRVRFTPIEGSLYRAQPLTAKGVVDKNEEPIDFGLVELGSGKYMLVYVEEEGDEMKSAFIGVQVEEGKLTLYFFAGGETDFGAAAFIEALAKSGFTRDPAMRYEVRLAGDVTKDRIKALFELLMSDPVTYEPSISVYKKR